MKSYSVTFFHSLRVLGWLLWRDFIVFKKNFFQSVIDALMWPMKMVLIFGYMMPALGLGRTYGGFSVISNIATIGIFTGVAYASQLLTDLHGDRTFEFYLGLPVSRKIIFIREVLFCALKCAVLSMSICPVGVLMLGDRFGATQASHAQFSLIFILTNLWWGALALFLTGMVHRRQVYGSWWGDACWTMWDLGCFLFSWNAVMNVSPTLGALLLCNPMSYAMEGLRGAIFGFETSIPFHWCVVMLLLTVAFFWSVGARALSKKMDCV